MTERVNDGCLASWIDRAEADYGSARWDEDFVEVMLDLRDARTLRLAADARADKAEAALAETREAFEIIGWQWCHDGDWQGALEPTRSHAKAAAIGSSAEDYDFRPVFARLAADTPATPADPYPDRRHGAGQDGGT